MSLREGRVNTSYLEVRRPVSSLTSSSGGLDDCDSRISVELITPSLNPHTIAAVIGVVQDAFMISSATFRGTGS